MAVVEFAQVLLEDNPRAAMNPLLYLNAPASVVPSAAEEGCWEFAAPGTYDFTSYFNALSVVKLRAYTRMTSLRLRLRLRGAAAVVEQTRAHVYSYAPQAVCPLGETAGTGEWETVEAELSLSEDDVLVAFRIQTQGPVTFGGGCYLLVMDGDPEPVELALATTTFRKEAYIQANVAAVRSGILAGNDELAGHFRMYVVDNGRTLDAQGLSGGGVQVLPNPNAGGAGGFARGMIEALSQTPAATHVLLMDDDVAVSCESIRRTFNLLRCLKPEFADAFVSGAMMSMADPTLMWEDVGWMRGEGDFFPAKPHLRVTNLHEVVQSELFVPTAEQRSTMYAGWWYCCIPCSVVREKGLPLPLFVRFDDSEYGIRCQPSAFITMNGICVWHEAFDAKYSAAVERYQVIRNPLIGQAATGIVPGMDLTAPVRRYVDLELRKFNYTNAELVLEALADFLKGPSFIMEPGVAEERFMWANRAAEKLVPLDELRVQMAELPQTADLPFDLGGVSIEDGMGGGLRARVARALVKVTRNYQVTLLAKEGEGASVIPVEGNAYPLSRVAGRRYLVAVDPHACKGVLRTKDPARCKQVVARMESLLKEYAANRERLLREYSAASAQMTSVDFWRTYLDISR